MRFHQVALASVAAIALTGPAVADSMGQQAFQQYCATCHGTDGAGGGPLTDLLLDKVPDLTGLTARNDGKFPMLKVIHIIDGRTGLRGHGGPMPVYGALFDEEGGDLGPFGAPIYTRGKILSIAYYLESIQK